MASNTKSTTEGVVSTGIRRSPPRSPPRRSRKSKKAAAPAAADENFSSCSNRDERGGGERDKEENDETAPAPTSLTASGLPPPPPALHSTVSSASASGDFDPFFAVSPATPAAVRKNARGGGASNERNGPATPAAAAAVVDESEDEVDRIIKTLLEMEGELVRLRRTSSRGSSNRSVGSGNSLSTGDVWDGIDENSSAGAAENEGDSSNQLDLQSRMDHVESQIRAQNMQDDEARRLFAKENNLGQDGRDHAASSYASSAPSIPLVSSACSSSPASSGSFSAAPLISELTLTGRDISTMVLSELQIEKRNLKRRLQKYDAAFYKKHGVPPAKADKEPIRPWYETYNAIKARIGMLERGEVTVDASGRGKDLESIAEHMEESDDESNEEPGDDDQDGNCDDEKEKERMPLGLLDAIEETDHDEQGEEVGPYEEEEEGEIASVPSSPPEDCQQGLECHASDAEDAKSQNQESFELSNDGFEDEVNEFVRQEKEEERQSPDNSSIENDASASASQPDLSDKIDSADADEEMPGEEDNPSQAASEEEDDPESSAAEKKKPAEEDNPDSSASEEEHPREEDKPDPLTPERVPKGLVAKAVSRLSKANPKPIAPTNDCFITETVSRLSYRKSGAGPALRLGQENLFEDQSDGADLHNEDEVEEEDAGSQVNTENENNGGDDDDCETEYASQSSTATLEELNPSTPQRLIRQSLAKTLSAPITKAINVPNLGITPPTSPDRSTHSGSDMSPVNVARRPAVPIAVLLMDVRRNKFELLRLDVKWEKYQVGDVIDAVTSAIHAEEEQRGRGHPPQSVCIDHDPTPSTPPRGVAVVGETPMSPLTCASLSPSRQRHPETIDVEIKRSSVASEMGESPMLPFEAAADGPGGIKIGSWQVHYDGLIQCREGDGSDARVLLINCIGLSRYEVAPHEVFVAKPVGMSAKETSRHSSRLIRRLVREGMFQTKTEESMKCTNETVTILSDEARDRSVVFPTKKQPMKANFLVFLPPFGPMAKAVTTSVGSKDGQSEILNKDDSASAISSVSGGSVEPFTPSFDDAQGLPVQPLNLFPAPGDTEASEVRDSSLPPPVLVDFPFAKRSTKRRGKDLIPGSFDAAIGCPRSPGGDNESVYGEEQILLIEEDSRAMASYRKANAWRCSQAVLKRQIKSLGSITAGGGVRSKKSSLKINALKKKPNSYSKVDEMIMSEDGPAWDERTFTTFNEETGDVKSIISPCLTVLSEDTEDDSLAGAFLPVPEESHAWNT